MLHPQTLDLLERTRATSRAPVNVYRPVQRSGDPVRRPRRQGARCTRASSCARPAATSARSSRWSAGAGARQRGLDHRPAPRAVACARRSAAGRHQRRPASSSIPLANWTWGDVWHYISVNKVDYNPLHDEFYPSIGCAPCTRAISLGEDFRAGRWWWEDEAAKECGLHVKNDEPKEEACRMNARAEPHLLGQLSNTHLDALEEETIFILREVAAAFERPTLLFSGGKDSLVLLKCAEKAFGAGRIPYPLLMIDTGHNFPEVTDFRDFRAKELGAELIVRNVEDSMKRGTVRLAHPGESRNVHQSVTLLEAIEEFRFDALIGGARRDEEKARAKERIFSHRDSFGQWQPKAQRPELWTLFNTRLAARRALPRVPDLQLDRAGRVAIHRAREHRPALDLLRAPAPGGRAQGPAGAGDRADAAARRRGGRDPHRALPHRGRHHLHLPGGKPRGQCGAKWWWRR